ncbi:hypothetical protein [Sphingopyxis chilensis]|uniref:hypothetical protein n=1 Tax=Sphingopyxis chilensis TaxID=180400 RepID=UPI002DDCA810|nr:hypothetical protein [Sphingopyxis chilensis]
MRITINGFEVEGTPDEIAALIRAQGQAPTAEASPKSLLIESNDDDDERFASEKIAYRALRRRPLSVAQRSLFRSLLDAYPEWVSASDLQTATSYNPNQLGGLLGAIGRRLSQTEGHALGSSLIEWVWNADEGEYAYRLPPSVCAAVRRIDP